MAKERLPFELAKPSNDTFVTETSEIGHNGQPLDEVLEELDNISKQSAQSEEQAIIYETDGGVQVGKIDANGADFINLKRGGQQVARMSDLPTVPALDTSIGSSPSNSHTPSTKAVKDYVDDNIPEVPEYPIETESTSSDTEEQVWGDNAETQEYAKVGSYGIKSKAYLDMQGNSVIPTKDISIGETPSQTNVPTSKAVADYVEAHGGGIGDLPISQDDISSGKEEVVYGNDDGTQIYAKFGSYGLKVKALLNLNGEPIGGLNLPNTIVVDAAGNGDYTTIEDALANAGDTASRHVNIIVMPGTYYPAPKLGSNNIPYPEAQRNISIIGVDRDACILRGDVGYYDYTVKIDYALLRLSGNVLIKNLTMINTCENYISVATENDWDLTGPHAKAYCWHRDHTCNSGDISAMVNCKLYNDHFAAIGFGLRPNTTLSIRDTEIVVDVNAERNALSECSPYYGALFGHLGGSTTNAFNQDIEMINCIVHNVNYETALRIDGIPNMTGGTDSVTSKLLFINNKLISTNQSAAFVRVVYDGYPNINAIDVRSCGNNIPNANYKNEAGTTTQRPTLNSGDEGFKYYDSTLKKEILWNGSAWINVDGKQLS